LRVACLKVREEKGRDYTRGDRDPLANFYGVSGVLGVPPLTVWGVYVLKHVYAIQSYLAGLGESEPIEGRLCDVIVYAALGYFIASRELEEGGLS
jgi:hypothetical protein